MFQPAPNAPTKEEKGKKEKTNECENGLELAASSRRCTERALLSDGGRAGLYVLPCGGQITEPARWDGLQGWACSAGGEVFSCD